MEVVRASVFLCLVSSAFTSPVIDYNQQDWPQQVHFPQYYLEHFPEDYEDGITFYAQLETEDPEGIEELQLQQLREKRSTIQWPNVEPSSSTSFSSSSGNSFSSNFGGALVSNSNTNTQTGASSTGGGSATGAATGNAGGAAIDPAGGAVTSNSNSNNAATAVSVPNLYGLLSPGSSQGFSNTQGNSFGSNINGALVSNGNSETQSGATSTGGGSASGVGTVNGNSGAFNPFNPLQGGVHSTTNSNSATNAQSQPNFAFLLPNCQGPYCPNTDHINKGTLNQFNPFTTTATNQPNIPFNSLPCQPFPQCLNVNSNTHRRKRSTCLGPKCSSPGISSSSGTSSSSGSSFSSNIGGALVSSSNTNTQNTATGSNGGVSTGLSSVNAGGSVTDLYLGSVVSGSSGNSAAIAAAQQNIYHPFNQGASSSSASTLGNNFSGNFAGTLFSTSNLNSNSGATSTLGGVATGYGGSAANGGAFGTQSQSAISNSNSQSVATAASLPGIPFPCTATYCPITVPKLHRIRRNSGAYFGFPGVSSSQSSSSGSSVSTNFGGTGVSNSNTQTFNKAFSSGGGAAVASSNSNAAGLSSNFFGGTSSSGSNSNSLATAISNQNIFRPVAQGGFNSPVPSLPFYNRY